MPSVSPETAFAHLPRAAARAARWLLGAALSAACITSAATGALAQEPAPPASDGLAELARALNVQVVEHGPGELWTLQLSNTGTAPVWLLGDPALLWFEVAVPGRATPEICRLPEPLWPTSARQRAQLVLGPGETFSRRFDPRFFCFADTEQRVLVPGAKVTPYFGWPAAAAANLRGKAAPRRTAPPAFVAAPLPPAPPEPAPSTPPATEPQASAEAEAPAPPLELGGASPAPSGTGTHQLPLALPTEGIGRLRGGTLELSPAYAEWSRPDGRAAVKDVALLMLAGSDAEDERSVTVTVGPFNGGSKARDIFVRRELIDYRVSGPDGAFNCPRSELGAPDFTSFTRIAPRRAEGMVVRLIEVCPRGSFSRPGLYEVRASYEALESGQAFGLDAFVGRLEAPRPALVRVRSGDRSSFLRTAASLAPGDMSGAPGAAAQPGAAPPEGGGEAAPEGLPADHGAGDAPPPEEAAPPPEPAETTE